jgi:hypothetical protein
MLSGKFFLNETKNHNPPLQVKWLAPKECGNPRSTLLEVSTLTITLIEIDLRINQLHCL